MFFGKQSKRIDRVALAEELADLRIRRFMAADHVGSDLGRKLVDQLAIVQREIWVELFLAHYSNKQLLALSEFYSSEIGRSIVATDLEVEKDFQEELRGRMERVDREVRATHKSTSESSASGGVLIRHARDGKSYFEGQR